MSHEPELLPQLSPPAGGLARLRARREQLARGPLASPRLAYAAAFAGASFAVLLMLPAGQVPATQAMDRLLGVRSQGSSLRIVDASTVAQALPTQQPGVRLYWTERLRDETPAVAAP